MCGINGFVKLQNNRNNLIEIIQSMNCSIAHRGPDANTYYCDEHIALGHRRLSIIDLNTGNQPIYNADKTKVIVFNGEIYNYKELRSELINKGYKFNTASDTEVIINLYEEYGNSSFNMLDGMFAFAIYNLVSRELILVRDRAGEKPLYYFKDDKCFVFSSELKGILASGAVEKSINKQALQYYFLLNYIPSPYCIFENISKLMPGHFITVSENGDVEDNTYWKLNIKNEEFIDDYDECKKKLRKAVIDSVKNKMVADVPVGAFLSGGIDSSIIVGIMASLSDKPIETFTIGFNDKEYDESGRAEIVAKKNGTNHHVKLISPKDILQNIDKIIDDIDEPFADQSTLATYIVSEYAKQYVKVVLTGDAGDELFAGYSRYLINYYSDIYNKIPYFIRKNFIQYLLKSFNSDSIKLRKIRKVINNSAKNIEDRRCSLCCLGFSFDEVNRLLNVNDDFKELYHSYYSTSVDERVDETTRALFADFKISLEGDMLTKVDRMSMLCSLESRVPLLSKDIIELTFKIPSKYKISNRKQKIIFRDTFSDFIPRELYNAPKKGFEVPVGKWIKEELKQEIIETLDLENLRKQGILNADYVGSLLEEHFSGEKSRSNEIWSIYVFEKWMSNYFYN